MSSQGYLPDNSVTLIKLINNILANSTAGRAKMEDGFLSADAAGLAKMADGFITPAKIQGGTSLLPEATEAFVTAVYNAITATAGSKLSLTDNKIPILYKAASSLTYFRNIQVDAGIWTQGASAGQSPLGYVLANNSTQNSAFSLKIFVPKTANYTLSMSIITSDNSGIYTVKINGVTVGTADGYSPGGGGVANVLKTVALGSLNVGEHTLQFVIATKNAAAFNYGANVGQLLIEEA